MGGMDISGDVVLMALTGQIEAFNQLGTVLPNDWDLALYVSVQLCPIMGIQSWILLLLSGAFSIRVILFSFALVKGFVFHGLIHDSFHS